MNDFALISMYHDLHDACTLEPMELHDTFQLHQMRKKDMKWHSI